LKRQNLTLRTTPSEKGLYAVKYYEGHTFPLPYHNHERYELTLILKGNGLRFVGDNVEEFSSGDMVLIGPFLPHKWQIDKSYPKEKQVKAISIFFEEDFPSKDFNALSENSHIEELKRKSRLGVAVKKDSSVQIAKIFKSLSKHSNLSLLLNLIGILNEIAKSDQYYTLSTVKIGAKSNLNNQRIELITDYINENLHRNITLAEISKIAFMHKNSIGRFFKKSIGFSVIEYINLLRIGKACQLLIETNKKISFIAYECGYENISHFNRTFKKTKQMTPFEYRKNRISSCFN